MSKQNENKTTELVEDKNAEVVLPEAGQTEPEMKLKDIYTLDYYDNVAKGEVIKKRWEFVETVAANDAADSQNTLKKKTVLTVTDKRLILLSDTGSSIKRITRDLDDIKGVGYTVKKNFSVSRQEVKHIGLPSIIAFAAVVPFLILAICVHFAWAIGIPVAIIVGLLLVRKELVEDLDRSISASVLEIYVNPYGEIQPMGSYSATGKDRSVVRVRIPECYETISLVSELDNLIFELKNNTCKEPAKEAKKETSKTKKK